MSRFSVWGAATAGECGEVPGGIWAGGLCDLPGQENQTMCEFYGGDWTSAKCSSLFLRGAVEIPGDLIGNDNGLCESGETCLVTPNIGAYQGHDGLVEVGAIGEGAALQRITLLGWSENGY